MPDPRTWTRPLLSALLDGDRVCLPGGLPEGCPSALRAFTDLPEGDARIVPAAAGLLRDPAGVHRETGPVVAILVLMRLGMAGAHCPEATGAASRALAAEADPVVKGLLMLGLAAHERDRLAHTDYADLVTGGVSLLPEDAPVRAVHLHQAALHLALRGMLRLLDGQLDLPQAGDAEPAVPDALLAECYYDAVANGRTAQAGFLLARCREAGERLAWQQSLIDFHAGYGEVFTAILGDRPLPPPGTVPSGPVIHALVGKDMDFLSTFVPVSGATDLPLIGYDGLRVALAIRDAATARRLYDERSHAAAAHPLDDLFLCRLLLLEDKPHEAARAADRLAAAGDRFAAWGRIEIELRLSLELTAGDLVRLGRHGTGPAALPADAHRRVVEGPSPWAGRLRERIEDAVAAGADRILVMGPPDGTRSAVAACIHARMGRSQLHRVSAPATTAQAVAELLRGPHGTTVFIDDLDAAEDATIAALLGALADGRGHPGLLILGGAEGLERRSERLCALAWSVDARVCIPGWSVRGLDAGVIIPSLVCGSRPRVAWTDAARRSLARRSWSGWPEVQSWARAISRLRPEGVVDDALLSRVARLLDSGESGP